MGFMDSMMDSFNDEEGKLNNGTGQLALAVATARCATWFLKRCFDVIRRRQIERKTEAMTLDYMPSSPSPDM